MLLVISLVTFGIFFLFPKLIGTDPALYFVGKQSDPAAIEGIRQKMGLDDPILVQFGKFVVGLVAGRTYANGSDVTQCAAPCFGYSFKTEQEVWPLLLDWLPVTLSLAAGAVVLWVIGGVATGVISALKRGTVLDRSAMGVALAGVSSRSTSRACSSSPSSPTSSAGSGVPRRRSPTIRASGSTA